jgi:hypothetical protein
MTFIILRKINLNSVEQNMIFIQLPLHYPCKNTKCRSTKKRNAVPEPQNIHQHFKCDLLRKDNMTKIVILRR